MDNNSNSENYIKELADLRAENERLKKENQIYDAILNHTHAKIFWKDRDRRFVGANKAFLEYYGFKSVDEIVGRNDEDMGWHNEPLQYMNDEMIVLEEGKAVIRSEGKCICKGQEREIVASKMPIFYEGQVVGLVGDFNDVTDTNASFKEVISEVNKVRDQLKKYEFYDQLTGVLNRSGAYEVAQDYEERYFEDQKDFTAIYFDIDNFRQYNDSYGYQFGDDLLINIARKIEDGLEDDCVLSRFGGDVFIVITRLSREDDIAMLLKRIGRSVGSIRKVDGYDISISIKSGFAKYSEYMDIDRMFLEAERMLYEEKNK
ncbi:PAS domain S-box-containing protein/diguanylate cyclase (GGDEF) domain-containing protein [Eubacterium ruminantium]|nr:PAS domain S-box-containing protein/diguanylate cyclase (GGDEF) domain-containing protein [Eubacterium ruminantium]